VGRNNTEALGFDIFFVVDKETAHLHQSAVALLMWKYGLLYLNNAFEDHWPFRHQWYHQI
jgi:hypothetical protein